MPRFYPDASTFEQQLLRPTYAIYRFQLWVVLLHILLVWISMIGLGAGRLRQAAGPVVFGMMGYGLFGVAELFRTSFVMFVVNSWRAEYRVETVDAARSTLYSNLQIWPQFNLQLFFLLLLGFFIGNLSYGIALWKSSGLERLVSSLLLLWAVFTGAAIAHDYMGQAWARTAPEFFDWTYQPAVRLLVGVLLWRWAALSANGEGASPVDK